MPKGWELMTSEGRANLMKIYHALTGKQYKPPKKKKRGIECEVKIDSKELEREMKQVPGYTIEKEGR